MNWDLWIFGCQLVVILVGKHWDLFLAFLIGNLVDLGSRHSFQLPEVKTIV